MVKGRSTSSSTNHEANHESSITNEDLAKLINDLKLEQINSTKDIKNSIRELKGDVAGLRSDLSSTKESLEYSQKELEEVAKKTSKIDLKVDYVESEIETLKAAGAAAEAKMNTLEAYTRQWSIRIMGLNDKSDTDCLGQVATHLETLGFKSNEIELAHWVGSQSADGYSRHAIARLHSRSTRTNILKAAKVSPHPTIRVFADLTKKDYDAKKNAKRKWQEYGTLVIMLSSQTEKL